MPLIRYQALVGLDPKGIVKPSQHQIELYLTAIEQQGVTGFLWNFLGSREHSSPHVTLRKDPGPKRETVIETKIGHIARRNKTLSIEVACQTDATDCILRLAVYKLS